MLNQYHRAKHICDLKLPSLENSTRKKIREFCVEIVNWRQFKNKNLLRIRYNSVFSIKREDWLHTVFVDEVVKHHSTALLPRC